MSRQNLSQVVKSAVELPHSLAFSVIRVQTFLAFFLRCELFWSRAPFFASHGFSDIVGWWLHWLINILQTFWQFLPVCHVIALSGRSAEVLWTVFASAFARTRSTPAAWTPISYSSSLVSMYEKSYGMTRVVTLAYGRCICRTRVRIAPSAIWGKLANFARFPTLDGVPVAVVVSGVVLLVKHVYEILGSRGRRVHVCRGLIGDWASESPMANCSWQLPTQRKIDAISESKRHFAERLPVWLSCPRDLKGQCGHYSERISRCNFWYHSVSQAT